MPLLQMTYIRPKRHADRKLRQDSEGEDERDTPKVKQIDLYMKRQIYTRKGRFIQEKIDLNKKRQIYTRKDRFKQEKVDLNKKRQIHKEKRCFNKKDRLL